MPYIVQAKNVNEALGEGLSLLKKVAVKAPSRNGEVLVAPGPVITEYENPKDRVLFSPLRDANPFFHLMEALWMLGGHNDVAWPQQFNSKFGLYSDDGLTVHGAYGHRWRNHFGQDQLNHIIRLLRTEPTTRRAVLAMWHPEGDLWKRGTAYPASGVDLPCNTHIYFSIGLTGLDMTVCCRSNDIIWGAYGANAVHMSILQEYIAAAIGVPVGSYFQFSNNFHAYTNILAPEKYQEMIDSAYDYDYYGDAKLRNDWSAEEIVTRVPLVSVDMYAWQKDLNNFLAQALVPVKYITIRSSAMWRSQCLTHGAVVRTSKATDLRKRPPSWRTIGASPASAG